MLIKAAGIPSSDITDKRLYMNRRAFIQSATGAALSTVATVLGAEALVRAAQPAPHGRKLANVTPSALGTGEQPNTWEQVTTYNNYYEFGTDKEQPSRLAGTLTTEPWTVVVEGECNKPAVYHLEDVLKGRTLEDRIYRHRCVEAWSMVIPWVGFPLADFITKCEPTSKAHFIEVTTLHDPKQMPGTRVPVLPWPYVEGLRMDEAMHPLTILVVGLYGEVLPNQNGAPLRLAVPWKYGFKHVKSIVKMRFVEQQPLNTWRRQAPNEYGFYANVNPAVDHPRWSQATERRLPGLFKNHKTLMFNGYSDQVAGLYAGMDLRKNF
ncbi:MAG TPA: protein-methionine-sulfoxide reductase catalytic subunit MsrP [Vicinamibacterales bacterium]|nr:protein-methionine-sulfoxide reductase catalytic subunit MsrP [Vicinamibacterales bacterium]